MEIIQTNGHPYHYCHDNQRKVIEYIGNDKSVVGVLVYFDRLPNKCRDKLDGYVYVEVWQNKFNNNIWHVEGQAIRPSEKRELMVIEDSFLSYNEARDTAINIFIPRLYEFVRS